jgi:hypothetical protein
MSGQWPPEWEDSDDGPSDARLPDGSAVTSFLAEVGSPVLPAAFAEAAARASTPQAAASVAQAAASVAADAPVAEAGAEEAKGRDRSANPEEFSPVAAAGGSATSASRRLRRASRSSRSAAASGPGGSRPGGRRRRLRMPYAQASGWVVVCCLVIAGFGFLVSHTSGSSSSSSPYSPAAGAASAASSHADASEPRAASGSGAEHADQEPTTSAGANVPTGSLYVKSGTTYQASTLATQVEGVLNELVYAYRGSVTAASASASVPASVPSATAPPAAAASSSAAKSSGGGYLPSARLEACVSRVTGGVTPRLVDKASYDGKPAYIIAVPSQAWVVGLGCTAADTDVIAQVPLKG